MYVPSFHIISFSFAGLIIYGIYAFFFSSLLYMSTPWFVASVVLIPRMCSVLT